MLFLLENNSPSFPAVEEEEIGEWRGLSWWCLR